MRDGFERFSSLFGLSIDLALRLWSIMNLGIRLRLNIFWLDLKFTYPSLPYQISQDLEINKIDWEWFEEKFSLTEGEITWSLNNPYDTNPFLVNISSLEIIILLDFNTILYPNCSNKDLLMWFLLMSRTFYRSWKIMLFS